MAALDYPPPLRRLVAQLKSLPGLGQRSAERLMLWLMQDGGRIELYDLAVDPGEARDLAKTEPEKAAALADTLRSWQRETGAAIPKDANLAYDPAARRPQDGPGGGAGGSKGGGGGQRPNRGGRRPAE